MTYLGKVWYKCNHEMPVLVWKNTVLICKRLKLFKFIFKTHFKLKNGLFRQASHMAKLF